MVYICGAILLLNIMIYAIFQGLYSKKCHGFFDALNDKDYSYKAFLPGCLGIVEALKLSGGGKYQTQLNQKLVMLHGSKYIAYYTKVHWSSKVFHMFLGITISSIFCMIGEFEYRALILIPISAMGMFFLADQSIDNQYKKRKFQLERDFPGFLSKLVLLINAGLNVRQAIERITEEGNCNSALYQELRVVMVDINAGELEYEAYAAFAERCKVKQITNFVSILRQNMKLGGGQMLFELKRMSTECWEMRKNTARQLGETASSKLMLPLAIMLLAVILICVAPVIVELGRVM